VCIRPVTSLGHQGGGSEEFSERGPSFLNYVQYFQTRSNIFFQSGRKLSKGPSPPGYVLCILGVVSLQRKNTAISFFQ